MIFNKKKFLNQVDKSTKRIYSQYLDEMEGKEVRFSCSDNYGKVNIKEGFIYPVNQEWCTELEQMRLDL